MQSTNEATSSSGSKPKKPKKGRIKKSHKIPKIIEIASAEVRLYRFLYTGVEIPKYCPGDLTIHKYFQDGKIKCIPELVSTLEGAEKVVEAIKFVKKGYHKNEPLYFALALAISSVQNGKLQGVIRQKLYNTAVEVICKSEEFLLFISYLRKLKTGHGRGWMNFVKHWYSTMSPQKLSREIIRVKAMYGWSHKDIVKLVHYFKPVTKNPNLLVLAAFLEFGTKSDMYKKVTDCPGSNDEALPPTDLPKLIDEYLELRSTRDPQALLPKFSNLITWNELSEEQKADIDFWQTLLPHISMEDILRNINQLHRRGYILDSDTFPQVKADSSRKFTASLIDYINSKTTSSPILAYIVLRQYLKGKRLTHTKNNHLNELSSKKLKVFNDVYNPGVGKEPLDISIWEKQRQKGLVYPPSTKLQEALSSLITRSLSTLTPKIRGRFMISIDMRPHMTYSHQSCRLLKQNLTNGMMAPENLKYAECFYHKNIVPSSAAVLLALYLYKVVTEVTIAVFCKDGLQCTTLKNGDSLMSHTEAIEKLQQTDTGPVALTSPMLWAATNGKQFDMFINIIDSPTRMREIPKDQREQLCNVQDALSRYQKNMNLPNTGLINIALSNHSQTTTDGSIRRILDIVGFDEHIPNVILAFADTAKEKL